MLWFEYMIVMFKGCFFVKDGCLKSFDVCVDGYGCGEGGGVVVLKSFVVVYCDNDLVLVIVSGVGVNQDGCISGIIVLNLDV